MAAVPGRPRHGRDGGPGAVVDQARTRVGIGFMIRGYLPREAREGVKFCVPVGLDIGTMTELGVLADVRE